MRRMTKALACLLAVLSFAGSAFTAEAAPIPTRRVVMVHGIFQDEWRCFGRLRRELEANGVECVCPSLKPADARAGLPKLAEQLKNAVDAKWKKNERFVLIGFSMGGLIGRHYLQELGGADRCDGIFTVATPHYGTRMAWMWYGEGAHQMRPGSDFLAHLAATEHRLGNIPAVTYRTCADLMIVPSQSCNWNRAENVTVSCPIHALMSCDPNVRQDIVGRLITPPAPERGLPEVKTRQQVARRARNP
jgi:triacylglycerol lipase